MSSITLLGDTSGSVLIQAPAVAGSPTLTLPTTTGTVMVNGPAFSAYVNASTSMTAGTSTKLAFQVEEWDTASCYNNTASTVGSIPSYSFLPNVAGYYQVVGSIQINGTTAGAPAIWKNGAVLKSGSYTGVAGTSAIAVISSVVYLNGTTDYIALYGYVDASTNLLAQPNTCYFQATMVRGN